MTKKEGDDNMINWAKKSIVDYARENNLREDLKNILRDEGYMDEDSVINAGFTGFKIDCVEGRGGEDMGSTAWFVYKITYPDEHKEFWKADVGYQSYDGYQWDYWNFSNFYKVQKKPVTTEMWVAE